MCLETSLMISKSTALFLSLLFTISVSGSAFASTLPVTDHRQCNEIAGDPCKTSDTKDTEEETPPQDDDDGISPPDCDFACE